MYPCPSKPTTSQSAATSTDRSALETPNSQPSSLMDHTGKISHMISTFTSYLSAYLELRVYIKCSFFAKSFSEVNPEHKSKYSAWETPDPVFWTSKGYVVVRADERGLGQSPGLLDTMSRGTSDCFFDVVEWAAEQPWSSGKVGLLGISYYAGTSLQLRTI